MVKVKILKKVSKYPAFKLSLRHSHFSKINLAVFILAFGVIGYILLRSFAAGPSNTANVFTSPNGSDTGVNCKRFDTAQTNPDPGGTTLCATPAKAWALAQGGDTVAIGDGDYIYNAGSGCEFNGTKTSMVNVVFGTSTRLICTVHFNGISNMTMDMNGTGSMEAFYDSTSHDFTLKNGAITCQDKAPYHLWAPANRCSARLELHGTYNFLFQDLSMGPGYDASDCTAGDGIAGAYGSTWNGPHDGTFQRVTFHDMRYQRTVTTGPYVNPVGPGCAATAASPNNPQHAENIYWSLRSQSNITFDSVTVTNGTASGGFDDQTGPDGTGPDSAGIFMTCIQAGTCPAPGYFSGLKIINSLNYGPNSNFYGNADAVFINSQISYNTFRSGISFQHSGGLDASNVFKANIINAASGSCPAAGASYDHNYEYKAQYNGGTPSRCGATDIVATNPNSSTSIESLLYADYANNDFHLKAGSPAIDKGDPASYPPADKDGTTRPQGTAPDIGAYEYRAGFTANVFVSANGSDTGANCKLFAEAVANPDPGGTSLCATFDKADTLAQAGQTVGVMPGSYPSQAILYHSTSQHNLSDGQCMVTPTGSRWTDVSDYSGCVTFDPTTGNRDDVKINGGLSVFAPGIRIRNVTILKGGVSAGFYNVPGGDACKMGATTAPLSAQPHDIVFDGLRDYTPGGAAANFDYHGLPSHPGQGAYFTTGVYNIALINSEWGPVYDNDGGWQLGTITPDDNNPANYATYCRAPFTNHQLTTRNIYINHLYFHDLVQTCTSNKSPPLPCPSGNLNHITGIHWGASNIWLMNSKFTNIAQQDVEFDILSGSGGDDPSLAEKNDVILGNVFGSPCAAPNPALYVNGDTSTCGPINGGGSINVANNSAQGLYLNNIFAFNSFFGNYSFSKANDTLIDWLRGTAVIGNIANMGTTPNPCNAYITAGLAWKYNANFASTPDLCDATDIALPTSPYADPNNTSTYDFTPTKADVSNLVPVSNTNVGSGGLSVPCPAYDLNGSPRPLAGNAKCSAGAIEYSSASGRTPLPPPTPKPGDINGDGKVSLADLAILLTHYGQTANASQGDLNGDGKVTLADLAILLTNYGR